MFQFKQFTIHQDRCAMKVGTDGVLLGAWAQIPPSYSLSPYSSSPYSPPRVLDVGTGTGVVAMMMAQRFEEATVVGIDIDAQAADQACRNAAESPFADRIVIRQQRIQDHHGRYDAIVSNPPFFIDSMAAPDRQRQTARHTTTMTYGDLMEAARRMLTDGGELSVIVPFDYRQRMEDEAIFQGLFLSRVCAVSTVAGKPPRRYLLAFRMHPAECTTEHMVIGDNSYRRLTDDFYLGIKE